MRHLFILNPAAGKRDQTDQLRQTIQAACNGLDYRIAVSQAPGDCCRLAREAAETGDPCRIYACGGDGTLNEVVSGVVGFPNVAVTHYACGSGNDFVRIFSDSAAFSRLERLMDCQETEFDLIRCNDRYALNICSVGLDARIAAKMIAYKRLPLVTGSGAYLLAALTCTLQGVAAHYVVELDGQTIDARQTLILTSNGRYYGGGFNPVPDADPTDGKLDVLLVTGVSRLQVLTIINKYKQGLYAQYPELIRHVATDHLRIRCDRPSSVTLDGEIHTAQEVDIQVPKEKLRFFYPKGLTFAAATPAGVT